MSIQLHNGFFFSYILRGITHIFPVPCLPRITFFMSMGLTAAQSSLEKKNGMTHRSMVAGNRSET
jgi:hypothetical protein